jgi:hypothetical protein
MTLSVKSSVGKLDEEQISEYPKGRRGRRIYSLAVLEKSRSLDFDLTDRSDLLDEGSEGME